MTIREVLNQFDELTPNSYPTPQKIRWLGNVEDQIYREIIFTHEDAAEYDPITADDSLDREMLAPTAYCDVYRFYLEAMTAQANNEAIRHNNAAAAFREAMGNFRNYWNRTHMPLQEATYLRVV